MPKQKILIVDDEETTVEILTEILKQNGYESEPTYNGLKAIEKLDQINDFDGIILDVLMPEMDGRETLKRLKSNQNTKNIPILMLTAVTDISNVSECLLLGANDYMVKPIDQETLISRLQKILPLTIGFES
ncbi:MAG: PleD family two-component system response regulator [Bdellovibrionales bacterium]